MDYIGYVLTRKEMLVDEFADYLKRERRCSGRTVTAYRSDLQQFCDFYGIEGKEEEFARVTVEDVRAWLAEGMRGGKEGKRKLSAASGKRKLSSLKAFFRYLEKRGVVKNSPAEDVSEPKLPKRLPVFVPEKEMEEVMDGMEEGGDFHRLRDWMVVLTAYDTGMRRSELAGLKVEDFDFGRRCVRVLGKGGKRREIPLLDELASDARCYLEERRKVTGSPTGAFFVTDKGNPMSGYQIYYLIRKVLSSDVNLSKRSPHVLRHTFATHLLDNEAPLEGIKELLGHSNLGVTQIYTHNSIERMKKVFKQAHPRA